MCLAVPGRITEIRRRDSILMGSVEFGGVTREVCLEAVPEARVGSYVIVHVGFAINILDEQEAEETLRLLREIASMESCPHAQP